MFERVHFRHCLGAHAEPDWATLHIDNRMVPILSRRGSGQANDVFCFHLLHHLLKLIFYTTVSEVIDYQRVAVLETA
jgi:hypothetical protein